MTLYDFIMGIRRYDKSDWAKLGRGEIMDEAEIAKMLMEGYGAMADDDS